MPALRVPSFRPSTAKGKAFRPASRSVVEIAEDERAKSTLASLLEPYSSFLPAPEPFGRVIAEAPLRREIVEGEPSAAHEAILTVREAL